MDGTLSTPVPTKTGLLVAVVGPSGVGKDSLIGAARAALSGSTAVTFARRLITRPADEAGENHMPVSEQDFDRLQSSGAFAVSWDAHGLKYGVPATVLDDLAAGRIVVVNGSRSALGWFQQAFPHLLVVSVTAKPEVLAARLAARGRESREEIEARLTRAVEPLPESFKVVTIDNSGPLEEGVEKLVSLLRELQSAVA
ncbi:phosphonate metabolism protein/1,5-bisphosphokinase (PRPP-forming) PhnN [Rhizobium glycinendophyticum]|uniref:Ribose 1,5-bisphosphate phosphokinase PhnN n=1 Tax=Rhizobium glycinendophyticum TaxID=2589807 RepID=A0A504TTD0_9HYPH|nr:phosphonate metabolism protein/1,5-bisphosphokinase (PRPP-forming) PhnN [Rhizobium glycinendophyticum]TPP05988.1 phosphonate metabolism protein/1,5-bisphosphokinase (PRPP-forming) PhnN [Rhizobium glycinendophyticum]